MQGERWRQIDQIFHSALQLEGSRRDAFLNETCSSDDELRREIDRLLAYHSEAGTFLESPALHLAAQGRVESESLSSQAGERLASALVGHTVSHYKILAAIGGGGMGVVYEAEDLRLGRRVALKFLREGLSRDAKALQRFEAEARAASSLNHPNICTIYAVEEHDGHPVIVMELLEGLSLKEKIREQRLPLQKLLQFGIEVCAALQAAHAKGIIHRDIKPANIFVVRDDRVKLLDFGVAKVILPRELEDGSRDDSLTAKGGLVGTMSYMSPEQVTGEQLDGRSDLFSLGVVLYEMATGRQPFTRRNSILTADAILHESAAAPSSLNRALPSALDTVIAKMLAKDRKQRYQEAAAVAAELKRLAEGAAPAVRLSKRGKVAGAALAGAAIILGTGTFLYLHRTPALTAKDTIVIADFVNTTGDPVFDGTLRQGLVVQLEQSPFLSIVSEERIQQTLRLMDQKGDARLTSGIAREICQRTGGAAVLEGSIARLGARYVLGLRANNCHTGEGITEEQGQAGRKEDVLNTLSDISTKLRSRLGESLATVKMHGTPLVEATTSSLEALKAYDTAWKVSFSGGPAEAVSLLNRAIQIDPKFAMAHAVLANTYSSIWEPVLAAQSANKAFELRERASDQERFFITFSYYSLSTGDLVKAQQTAELWAQAYPRDSKPHGFLPYIYQQLGQYERSVQDAKVGIDQEPDLVFGYNNLAWAYVFLDRWDEAEETLRRAEARKLFMPEFLVMRYSIAFLKNDKAGMEKLAAQGQAKSGAEDWISHEVSTVLADAGRLEEARALSRRAIDQAKQTAQPERAALYHAGAAVREGLFGNAAEARRNAGAALALSKSRDVEYGAAFALALAGDRVQPPALANDLEKRFPEDTFVKFTYLPTLRAVFALNEGRPSDAIESLRVALPRELGVPGSWSGFYGTLYPAYVRGAAFLAQHKPAQAATEFQKIFDYRSLVFSDPVAALTRLQMARAYALSGDNNRAKTAYEKFLAGWKYADAGIPILKQARLEYARLR